MRYLLLCVALLCAQIASHPATAQVDRDDWPLEEPAWSTPGPYRGPAHQEFALASFGADQKIVGTYFFYW